MSPRTHGVEATPRGVVSPEGAGHGSPGHRPGWPTATDHASPRDAHDSGWEARDGSRGAFPGRCPGLPYSAPSGLNIRRAAGWARVALGLFFAGLFVAATGQGAAPPPTLLDTFGDPLPPGALARYGTVRLRHPGLTALEFTGDGQRLFSYATTSKGTDLRLWDAVTGKLVGQRHLSPVETSGPWPVFAPDGSVYQLGPGHVYHLKDLQSNKRILYREDNLLPTAAVVSRDGKLLAVATQQRELLLFDLPDGRLKSRQKGEADRVGPRGSSLTFSPDGKVLALARRGGQVMLWDLERGFKLTTSFGKEKRKGGEARGVTFSPDGRSLLVHFPPRGVRMVDTATAKEVIDFRMPGERVVATCFSADGKELLAVDQKNRLVRHEARTGKEIAASPLPTRGSGAIRRATFSANAGRVAVSDGVTIHVVDTKTGQSVHPHLGTRDPVHSVAWVSGKELLSLTTDARTTCLCYWDPNTGRELRTRRFGANEQILAVDPTGKLALVGSGEKPPRLIRVADGQQVWAARADEMIARARFSPDGRWLATTSPSSVSVYDAGTGKVCRTVATGSPEFPDSWPVSWSPDGRMVALVHGYGDKVTTYELATGQSRHVLAIATGHVVQAINYPASIQFTPEGRHLAVVTTDHVIQVYPLGAKKPAFEVVVRPETMMPLALAFAPRGDLFAAACGEDVRVWDMTGAPRGILRGHRGQVSALAFADDGRTLASASMDGTGLVWDLSHLKRVKSGPEAGLAEAAVWDDLAAEDPGRAYAAMTYLQARPTLAVGLLSRHLRPTTPLPAATISKLLRELDSDDAKTRRAALASLAALDLQIEGQLVRARDTTSSAEVKRAIGKLLVQLEGATLVPSRLREVRAVEVLETIATPEARALLTHWAKGADGRLAREAKEALARLK